MEIYLAVTIDTECDKGPGWRVQQPIRCRSVLEGIPLRLQPLFQRVAVKPTYLLSPEIIEEEACVRVLRQLSDTAELGTHLHGEFIEPNRPRPQDVALTQDMQRQYPPEIERAKLENLTRLFESRFGSRPLSFRAGRFGIGNQSLGFLDDLGYRVDSSVTPFVLHDDFNFWGCPVAPYRPSRGDPGKEGALRILEAPVTIHSPFLSRFPAGWLSRQRPRAWWYRAARKVLGRESLRPIWLRPSFRDFGDMRRVIDAHLRVQRRAMRALLVMMFHSVEVVPAASPYAQTAGDVVEFLRRLDQTLAYCQEIGARSIGLSDAATLEWARGTETVGAVQAG